MIAVFSKTSLKPSTIAFAVLMVASGLTLYWFNPLQQLGWLRCPVNLATGLYCPGCGSLRAIHALLHGELLAAAGMNLLTVIALPVLFGFGVRGIIYNLQGKAAARVSPLAAWSVFWAVIVFTVVRNLPVAALHFLRP